LTQVKKTADHARRASPDFCENTSGGECDDLATAPIPIEKMATPSLRRFSIV